MTTNPLAGLADVMAGLAKAWSGKPLVVAPREARPLNRAQRRRAGIKQPTKATTSAARRRARQAGYASGRQGVDHRTPGACPYTNRALIDAWSEGYVDGKRRRKAHT